MDMHRMIIRKDGTFGSGPVAYWMSREQRLNDNWPLWYAQDIALSLKRPLLTVFTHTDSFLNATAKIYNFILSGLQKTAKNLTEKNIF